MSKHTQVPTLNDSSLCFRLLSAYYNYYHCVINHLSNNNLLRTRSGYLTHLSFTLSVVITRQFMVTLNNIEVIIIKSSSCNYYAKLYNNNEDKNQFHHKSKFA